METAIKPVRWPELGFVAIVSGHLAITGEGVEGALEWATLVLGVLIGLLTVARLLLELSTLFAQRRGGRSREIQKKPGL